MAMARTRTIQFMLVKAIVQIVGDQPDTIKKSSLPAKAKAGGRARAKTKLMQMEKAAIGNREINGGPVLSLMLKRRLIGKTKAVDTETEVAAKEERNEESLFFGQTHGGCNSC
jgi:hypothetical protein